jgi:hypothetical protein
MRAMTLLGFAHHYILRIPPVSGTQWTLNEYWWNEKELQIVRLEVFESTFINSASASISMHLAASTRKSH